MKVRLSNEAREDILVIEDYIAHDSPFHAIAFIEKIIDQTLLLEDNPKLGRVVPEVKDESIRELILGNYRIVYKVVSDELISILMIAHSKQNLSKDDFS